MMTDLTIGQFAGEARVNVETVRYYERRRLRFRDSNLSSGPRSWVSRCWRSKSCSIYESSPTRAARKCANTRR